MDGGCGRRGESLHWNKYQRMGTYATRKGQTTLSINENLTTIQEEALVAYRRLTEKHGEPPAVRTLAAALGKSPNAAMQLINQLRKKGYLTMKPTTIIRPKLTAKARRAE